MAENKKKIVGITACAAGIAHTYMAADSLKKAGEAMGYEVHIETQGATGAENILNEQDIQDAEAVIIASDVKIDATRFKGKKVLTVPVARAVKDAKGLINTALSSATVQGAETNKDIFKKAPVSNTDVFGNVKGKGILAHIMTGIAWVMPLIVACGLLLALANALANENLYSDSNGTFTLTAVIWSSDSPKPVIRFIALLSIAGFKLMVPIFAAFIAYSIGDKPAVIPALVCGWLINDNSLLGVTIDTGNTGGIVMPIEPGAGFLGGILVGFLTGYLVKWVRTWRLPQGLKGLMPFLIIPLCITLVEALFIRYVIGALIAQLVIGMFDGLQSLQETSVAFPIVIAIIICMMMSIDMGGPINKTANIFATIVFYQSLSNVTGKGLSMWNANFIPWSGMIAAICVPPLGIWLSTVLFKNKFTKDERATGKTILPMGIMGITEGAIPFASKDPLRVIPSCMIGCAVTGVTSVLLGAKFIGGVAGPLGLFTFGNTGFFQDSYPWWVFVWAMCFWSGAVTTALLLGCLRKKISADEMAELNVWKAQKRIQHQQFRSNVKLLFTHPTQAFSKMNARTKTFTDKRKAGCIDYIVMMGNGIQKYFELWGGRFIRFGRFSKRVGIKIGHFFKDLFTGKLFKKKSSDSVEEVKDGK